MKNCLDFRGKRGGVVQTLEGRAGLEGRKVGLFRGKGGGLI